MGDCYQFGKKVERGLRHVFLYKRKRLALRNAEDARVLDFCSFILHGAGGSGMTCLCLNWCLRHELINASG